jgi:hypothetical protein
MLFALALSKLHILQRAARLACCTLLLSSAAAAFDLNGLVAIGPMAAYTASGDGITVTCTDQSQVRFQVLAADLIRVRASFGKHLPERDHSWANRQDLVGRGEVDGQGRIGRLGARNRRLGGCHPPPAVAG